MSLINGFIIGNGESRKGFDLNSLRHRGKIYGCNALYRDFKPDTLVAVDKNMIKEILLTRYDGEFIFYDRSTGRLATAGRFIFTFDYRGWAAGPTATWLLCHRFNHHIDDIFLIGFDFYPYLGNKINNVYKNTTCYRSSRDNPPDPKNWIDQFGKIFVEFRNRNFYQVQKNKGDNVVEAFKEEPNFQTITYEEMMEKIK